jgi:glycine cleavage system H protein
MAAESYPQDLKYFSEHDWVRIDGDEAVLGITWWAQKQLGDIVFANLPELGAVAVAGQPYGELDAVKFVAQVYSPVSGEVVARNEALMDEPELVNTDPYGEGWLVRVRQSDIGELETLMDADAYVKFLAEAGTGD